MDPTYPLFPTFAFIAFILVLIPLPWHLQALNSGTCLFMIWTAIACLNQFINSILWRNDAIDRAPIWCDISSRLMVGIAVAIPAASLCINRRLYKIATCQSATITHAHKKRAVMVDLLIGLGIPALQMILQFIVQGHRYDIWEEIGCLPTTVNTPPAYPLSFLWPNVISAFSAVYCVLTIRSFMQRRAQFSQFLSSRTSLSVNRYFRLMCLATTEIFLTVPISSYGLYLNIVSKPIYPWKSWSDIHFDWYTIDAFPAALWRTSRLVITVLELSRWSPIVCSFVFFGFFGFSDEACKSYRRAYCALKNWLGGHPSSHETSSSHKLVLPLQNLSGTLPVFNDKKLTPSLVTPNSHNFTFSRQSHASSDTYTETLMSTPTAPHANFKFVKSLGTSESSRLSCVTI